jgi:hypothetical protein
MTTVPEEPRAWEEPAADAERAVDEMRRSIQRVREQVRSFRQTLKPDADDAR